MSSQLNALRPKWPAQRVQALVTWASERSNGRPLGHQSVHVADHLGFSAPKWLATWIPERPTGWPLGTQSEQVDDHLGLRAPQGVQVAGHLGHRAPK